MKGRHIACFLLMLLPLYGNGCDGDGDALPMGGDGGQGPSPMGTGGSGGLAPFDILQALSENAYVLIDAQATVVAGGRVYSHRLLEFPDVGVVGGCSIFPAINEDLVLEGYTVSVNFVDGWPPESSNRMSLFTPVGFPSDSLAGAEVQMGVFDAGSGEEWSVRPPGTSSLDCRTPENNPNVFICDISWYGEMTENCASPCTEGKEGEGSAQVSCVFAKPDSTTCTGGRDQCDDKLGCTLDFCDPDTGICYNEDRSARRLYGLPISQFCRIGGELGLCIDGGECVAFPCSDSCRVDIDVQTCQCTAVKCELNGDCSQVTNECPFSCEP